VTVIFGSTWQPGAGRLMDVVAAMGRAKSIHERVGADVRAWQLTAAGPASGQLLYLMEFASGDAYGSSIQTMLADPEWQAFTAEVLYAREPAATLVGQGLARVIPELDGLGNDPGTPGPRVRAQYRWMIKPGQAQAAIQALTEVRPVVAAAGARVRTVQFLFNGPETGGLVSILEFENLAAFGGYQDRAANDVEFQQVVARLTGPESPLQFTSGAIATELEI